jgi:hypothetical protein
MDGFKIPYTIPKEELHADAMPFTWRIREA